MALPHCYCQLAKVATVSSFVSSRKVSPGPSPSQQPLNPTWVHRILICSHAVRLLRPISLEAPCSPFLTTFPEPPGPCCFPGLDLGRACVPFLSLSSHIGNMRTFSGTHQSLTSSSPLTLSLSLLPPSVRFQSQLREGGADCSCIPLNLLCMLQSLCSKSFRA